MFSEVKREMMRGSEASVEETPSPCLPFSGWGSADPPLALNTHKQNGDRWLPGAGSMGSLCGFSPYDILQLSTGQGQDGERPLLCPPLGGVTLCPAVAAGQSVLTSSLCHTSVDLCAVLWASCLVDLIGLMAT